MNDQTTIVLFDHTVTYRNGALTSAALADIVNSLQLAAASARGQEGSGNRISQLIGTLNKIGWRSSSIDERSSATPPSFVVCQAMPATPPAFSLTAYDGPTVRRSVLTLNEEVFDPLRDTIRTKLGALAI
jgi:hypothetical protein